MVFPIHCIRLHTLGQTDTDCQTIAYASARLGAVANAPMRLPNDWRRLDAIGNVLQATPVHSKAPQYPPNRFRGPSRGGRAVHERVNCSEIETGQRFTHRFVVLGVPFPFGNQIQNLQNNAQISPLFPRLSDIAQSNPPTLSIGHKAGYEQPHLD